MDILVAFECVQKEKYSFHVKNPRNEDEFRNAFNVFAGKIRDKAYKTFDGGEIENIFINPVNLGVTRMFGGSFSECVDVKFLIIKIDTVNYIDYDVDYKLYIGYPWEQVERALKGDF